MAMSRVTSATPARRANRAPAVAAASSAPSSTNRCFGPLWTARRRLDRDVNADPGSSGHPEQLVEQLGIRG